MNFGPSRLWTSFESLFRPAARGTVGDLTVFKVLGSGQDGIKKIWSLIVWTPDELRWNVFASNVFLKHPVKFPSISTRWRCSLRERVKERKHFCTGRGCTKRVMYKNAVQNPSCTEEIVQNGFCTSSLVQNGLCTKSLYKTRFVQFRLLHGTYTYYTSIGQVNIQSSVAAYFQVALDWGTERWWRRWWSSPK